MELRAVKPAPCTICKKWARKIKGKRAITYHHCIQAVCSKTCVSYQSYISDTHSCWSCNHRMCDFCEVVGPLDTDSIKIDLNKVCELWKGV